LAALRDYQKLDTMRSPSSESRLDTGIILEELGDYDGAEAQYNAIPRASEGDDFRATIRLAAVARARGQLDRSLELINGLAVRHGPQTGMRYHYHRGWTLNAMGRFDEAIVDFTAGLETQPDYYWAYLRRACAYAGSGRLEYALSDLESGMAILRRTYGDRTPETRGDLTRALEIQSMLKNKLAAGDGAPSADACGGYPHDRSKARAKSPLLG
jgi:tetratricopeptide (TPR) repeat protein